MAAVLPERAARATRARDNGPVSQDHEPSADQLPLSLGSEPGTRPQLPFRLSLPLATVGHAPFDDEAYLFEPWWPGAQATLKREGDRLALRTEHLVDPLLAFPALGEVLGLLSADGVIIEGTLLALDRDGRPDGRLLRRCLGEGGVLEECSAGVFVATDMPYLDGSSIARMPFVERRRRLAAVLRGSERYVLSRGVVRDGRNLGRAASAMGLTAISARRLDARWKGGPAGDAWLRLPVLDPRPDLVVPLRDLLARLPVRE